MEEKIFIEKLNESEITNNLFVNQNSLSQWIKCPLCQFVLREPMRLNCGHSVCLKCLEFIGDYCPVDKRQYDPSLTGKDLIINSFIKDHIVNCIISGDGCTWNGKYEKL